MHLYGIISLIFDTSPRYRSRTAPVRDFWDFSLPCFHWLSPRVTEFLMSSTSSLPYFHHRSGVDYREYIKHFRKEEKNPKEEACALTCERSGLWSHANIFPDNTTTSFHKSNQRRVNISAAPTTVREAGRCLPDAAEESSSSGLWAWTGPTISPEAL